MVRALSFDNGVLVVGSQWSVVGTPLISEELGVRSEEW